MKGFDLQMEIMLVLIIAIFTAIFSDAFLNGR